MLDLFSRPLLKRPVRAGQLSLVLGAVLLFGTSLSALAIVQNTYPTITSTTLSPSTIDEGDTAAVNLAFTDPDPEDRHRVYIEWDISGEKVRQDFPLPPGQFSFQTAYRFPDGRRQPDGMPYPIKVRVWVSDEQPGNDNYDGAGEDGMEREITVNNVAPIVNTHTVTVT